MDKVIELTVVPKDLYYTERRMVERLVAERDAALVERDRLNSAAKDALKALEISKVAPYVAMGLRVALYANAELIT